jgi:D-alanyl-lipoteichoic acid acyltransferase DltB (MBOAT superfamily)
LLLTSSAFFIFLAAVLLLYWPVARWRTPALAVLLFANYFFYAKWDLFYLVLIPAASLTDYLIARGLGVVESPAWRRVLMLASVSLNIGLLVTFKYLPFFPFPVGLSFYTFQSLSYTMDCYRRDEKPTRSLLAYLCSVSLFPAILSGPITRPAALIPQLERVKKLLPEDGGRALFFIGLGMAKKFLIADYLSENLVNRVFDFPNLYSGFEVLVAVYAYAFQLYYDFSGYTDAAIGAALLLGLKLPPNFNSPYLSPNIADFWRRWHITLSNWLRDYVYFSFPGLRSAWMPYLALIATMLIGGVWHGSTWNFLIWGAMHGMGLAAYRAWQQNVKIRIPAPLAVLLTFHFVVLAWVFFRAATLEGALLILERIASATVSTANIGMPFALVLSIAALAHALPKAWFERIRDTFARAPFVAQAAALMALLIGIQYIGATGATPFIYTRF